MSLKLDQIIYRTFLQNIRTIFIPEVCHLRQSVKENLLKDEQKPDTSIDLHKSTIGLSKIEPPTLRRIYI